MKNSNESTRSITTFSQLVKSYDAFILDQYGVLHNGGNEPLPGVENCIEKLLEHGKVLCINSNSPRGANETLKKLVHKHGLKILYRNSNKIGCVTSGELLQNFLSSSNKNYENNSHYCNNGTKIKFSIKNKKCIFFGWNDDHLNRNAFKNLNMSLLSTVDSNEADFIVVTGTGGIVDLETCKVTIPSKLETTGKIEEKLNDLLRQCARRKLPMLVGNNDLIASNNENNDPGQIKYCGGMIAKEYESTFGGPTIRFGKPGIISFKECFRIIESLSSSISHEDHINEKEKLSIDHSRICHVGDSLHHDVLGANNSGIDSIFVASGIHSNDLGPLSGSSNTAVNFFSEEKLSELFNKHKIWPTHTVCSFTWT